MESRKIYYIILLLFISVMYNGCVEPFDIETKTFESAIVIEATITNEFKNQKIKITRTFRFEEDGPNAESNADVKVIDDSQNIYAFEEGEPGNYSSTSEFAAINGRNYQLMITTSDGRNYSSELMQLTNFPQTFDTSVLKTINDTNQEGISILVNSFDATGNSRFYRYEYIETYKIIAPFWSALDLVVVSDTTPFEVIFVPRTNEERICYNSLNSTKIIQIETNLFSEDRVFDFLIKFLSKDDFIISHRYSILVKQFVQSLEGFTFYKTLNNFSSSESLFSQNQTGFLSGNISSLEDSNEKVIGFFEVSSVLSQRIFFNYRDFFPDEPLPPFITNCNFKAPILTSSSGNSSPLINELKAGAKYFAENDGISNELPGPYLLVSSPCSDCTRIGSNTVPDFWID